MLGSALLISFTACEMPKPPTPQEIVSRSADGHITKAIMDNIKDKKYTVDYNSNRIIIKQYISGELGSMSGSAREAISRYNSSYDSSNDKIAQTYIEMAKNRGSTIKMYKQGMNLKIASIMPMNWDINNEPSYGNLDNALVEYDKNNRIKSTLIRVHTVSKYIGWIQYRFSMIMYGNLANKLESKIGNNTFDNMYITTMK